MFKCSNVQIFQYSNIPLFQCSNIKTFKFSNAQMLKCSNVQMFKCSNVRKFKSSNVQMSNIKCQMSIMLNFCRSVSPEFLRLFFTFSLCIDHNFPGSIIISGFAIQSPSKCCCNPAQPHKLSFRPSPGRTFLQSAFFFKFL